MLSRRGRAQPPRHSAEDPLTSLGMESAGIFMPWAFIVFHFSIISSPVLGASGGGELFLHPTRPATQIMSTKAMTNTT